MGSLFSSPGRQSEAPPTRGRARRGSARKPGCAGRGSAREPGRPGRGSARESGRAEEDFVLVCSSELPAKKISGASAVAVRWLQEMASREGVSIRHAGNGKEVRIRVWDKRFRSKRLFKLDGFCEETKTAYEFHGDYWHGSPERYEAGEPHPVRKFPKKHPSRGGEIMSHGDLMFETFRREQCIREAGYNLVVIWEHEYKKGLPPRVMPAPHT